MWQGHYSIIQEYKRGTGNETAGGKVNLGKVRNMSKGRKCMSANDLLSSAAYKGGAVGGTQGQVRTVFKDHTVLGSMDFHLKVILI